MDQRSMDNLNTLHPKFKPSAIQAWTEAETAMPDNIKIIVIQGLRTFEESDRLYAQGRTTPGNIVTYASAGKSPHNYGLAFDFDMVTNGKDDYDVGPHWMQVVDIMEKYGMYWGGLFTKLKDNPHFENWYGFSWQQLFAKHNASDFIPGTTYVNI
jgi:peptidoglycan L-alanyl-D-glutamate endopeptidase CwlK